MSAAPASAAPPCPICGATPTEPRHQLVSSHLAGRVTYIIRGCPDCGHYFACGPTDPATMTLVYGPGFHATSQQRGMDEASPVAVNARRRARWLATAGLQGRLLDIGAGNGYFVGAASDYFSAAGIEFSPAAAAAARAAGRPVSTGRFPEEAPPGPYDLITLWDVLAGLSDPPAALRAVHASLTLGGHVVFTVPLVSSQTARLLGRFWPLWIPPVNLHYFTPRSLRRLLQETGLEPLAFATESKQVALDFLVRKAGRAAGLPNLAERLGDLSPAWPVEINFGDILTVCARRPADNAA